MCPYDEILKAVRSSDTEKPHLTGPTTGNWPPRVPERNIQNVIEQTDTRTTFRCKKNVIQRTLTQLENVGHNGLGTKSANGNHMCPFDEVLEVLSSCGSAKLHLTGPRTGTWPPRVPEKTFKTSIKNWHQYNLPMKKGHALKHNFKIRNCRTYWFWRRKSASGNLSTISETIATIVELTRW